MTELVVTAMVTLFVVAVVLFWLDHRQSKKAFERRKQAAASLARQQDAYVARPTPRPAERRRQDDHSDYWTPTGYDYGSSQIHERLVPRPDPEPALYRPDDTPGHGGAIVGGSFRTAGSETGGGFSTGGSFGSDSSSSPSSSSSD